MIRELPNLIIVAGNGRNSGKTSICARIIRESGAKKITAVKISPHFHPATDGLIPLIKSDRYAVFEETNRFSSKDSSVLLQNGAHKVYFIQATDESISEAFEEVLKEVPAGTPVICESPSLIKHYEPGLFIIMISETEQERKDISEMRKRDHLEFTLSDINKITRLPISFSGGVWKSNR